jgi:hypothetical protein
MAPKFKKKLVLNKATIVNLVDNELKVVLGGASITSQCNACYTHDTFCDVCTIYCTHDTRCNICTYDCPK